MALWCKHLRALSRRGSVINTVANATAKVFISKHPNTAANVDIESSRWSKHLFTRMNFVKRWKTSSKIEIPEKAREEIELFSLQDTVSRIEQHHIPPALIVNIDQTPLNLSAFLSKMKIWQEKVQRMAQ